MSRSLRCRSWCTSTKLLKYSSISKTFQYACLRFMFFFSCFVSCFWVSLEVPGGAHLGFSKRAACRTTGSQGVLGIMWERWEMICIELKMPGVFKKLTKKSNVQIFKYHIFVHTNHIKDVHIFPNFIARRYRYPP